ncbi:ABC transporter permease [Nocardiopsis sp. L17-MgMaSL7]|uniref:ABC transporter permease n=1 Tax=Nocardiopsis sp. L17-MgMaSL7 TaxID=1938893 RepID=UPI000D7115D2|nr:ABC transporter permease [Nocardiopsis sp. L17-MgMaSL7]PWV49178.1 oleandomycin transport system permease protein [Nocardiopsis sp. L17-MgMaSL7]
MSTVETRTAAPRPAPLIRHSLVLARRGLAKSLRNPGSLVNGVMTPALFMILFVYLFGGSVSGSTGAYLQYLFPGVLVMGAGIAGMLSSGLTINIDMKKGVYDRFRSLPIGRSAPLLGSVLADLVRYLVTVLVLFAIGHLMGFRVETDPGSAIAACALAIGFGFGLSWVMVFLGVLLRDEGAVMAITFVAILPLLLGTSMAAPVETLPDWLRAWAGANPVTHAMDAARALLTGTPAGDSVALTLAWSAALVAVFAPLSVWAFNRER